jgi:hypothetical protein
MNGHYRDVMHRDSAEQLGMIAPLAETKAAHAPSISLGIPVFLDNPCAAMAAQAVTAGLPLPRGLLAKVDDLVLTDTEGTELPVQALPLARWPDGSAKWLLLDFITHSLPAGLSQWQLGRASGNRRSGQMLVIHEGPQGFAVDTGTATFRIDPQKGLAGSRLTLINPKGRGAAPLIERTVLEDQGPVRATIRLEGRFTGQTPCRVVARLCLFAGTGLVRLRLRIHNPRRARHRGGLWDLGDAGSTLFRDLTFELTLPDVTSQVCWITEPGTPRQRHEIGRLEIYQDSSGGDNWRSRNHVNRHNQVPCTFRGYRVRAGSKELTGIRASPVVSLLGQKTCVTVAVPEFWQQFPKAIEVEGSVLRVRLFPEQFGELFELQGGEQKTHTIWLHFGDASEASQAALDWVHGPVVAHTSPEWYSTCGALLHLAAAKPGGALENYLGEVIEGNNSLFARREIIDEYGWRHYGDVYADHEAAYYTGPPPVISHYNNQYDMVQGALLQYYRTGDRRWFELLDPLARHVIDIDIYHTDQDKAAYNGGLFWFTDHYKDAATCTHRTYSRANCRPGDRSYGGGPSSSHLFTTGLLHYFYLTGDSLARAAVLSLSDWVMKMDDGCHNFLGVIDDGPTGLASYTGSVEFHGPGRGCGLSINALLDGWLLTGGRPYLEKAEQLIRRCVHPADEIATRDLLNAEKRWSYTVFLSVLARYLQLMEEAGQSDFNYSYARASLLHYATWMLENELPYLDHPERLEYPTEAWAAQEFRKANVLRLAAVYAESPLRDRLLNRGQELADRAWADLGRFASRTAARAAAILMVEGPVDFYFRTREIRPAPAAPLSYDFGKPASFVPQKTRIAAQLRTVRGIMRAFVRLAAPRNWLKIAYRGQG